MSRNFNWVSFPSEGGNSPDKPQLDKSRLYQATGNVVKYCCYGYSTTCFLAELWLRTPMAMDMLQSQL
ncbi:hypothetical protein GOBAR_DD32100 [Gossypium barbadense]|nr:hypothetical protein GOBAR_DD32100 [Gossypium barbadense]